MKKWPEVIKRKREAYIFFAHFFLSEKKNKQFPLCKMPQRKRSHIVLYDAPNFYVQYLRYDHRYTYNVIRIRGEYTNMKRIYGRSI